MIFKTYKKKTRTILHPEKGTTRLLYLLSSTLHGVLSHWKLISDNSPSAKSYLLGQKSEKSVERQLTYPRR
jgi:hypothetical protein